MKNLLFNFIRYFRPLPQSLRYVLLWQLDGIRYLREIMKVGSIGERCRINSCQFGTEPYLIEIGCHVHVGNNVQFLTHDGGVWVLRDLLHDQTLDYFGKIIIRDNVFIGNNTIILPGITIGENVVVGAGSVVTKDIPPNVIAAGIPARVIKTIEEYLKKRDLCLQTKQLTMREKEEIIKAHFKKK